MPQQANRKPTRKTIVMTVVGTVGASVWAAVATLVIYLINGVAWGCWTDPDASAAVAAAWVCKMHLPNFAENAIQLIVISIGNGLSIGAAGYLTPPSDGDHIQP